MKNASGFLFRLRVLSFSLIFIPGLINSTALADDNLAVTAKKNPSSEPQLLRTVKTDGKIYDFHIVDDNLIYLNLSKECGFSVTFPEAEGGGVVRTSSPAWTVISQDTGLAPPGNCLKINGHPMPLHGYNGSFYNFRIDKHKRELYAVYSSQYDPTTYLEDKGSSYLLKIEPDMTIQPEIIYATEKGKWITKTLFNSEMSRAWVTERGLHSWGTDNADTTLKEISHNNDGWHVSWHLPDMKPGYNLFLSPDEKRMIYQAKTTASLISLPSSDGEATFLEKNTPYSDPRFIPSEYVTRSMWNDGSESWFNLTDGTLFHVTPDYNQLNQLELHNLNIASGLSRAVFQSVTAGDEFIYATSGYQIEGYRKDSLKKEGAVPTFTFYALKSSITQHDNVFGFFASAGDDKRVAIDPKSGRGYAIYYTAEKNYEESRLNILSFDADGKNIRTIEVSKINKLSGKTTGPVIHNNKLYFSHADILYIYTLAASDGDTELQETGKIEGSTRPSDKMAIRWRLKDGAHNVIESGVVVLSAQDSNQQNIYFWPLKLAEQIRDTSRWLKAGQRDEVSGEIKPVASSWLNRLWLPTDKIAQGWQAEYTFETVQSTPAVWQVNARLPKIVMDEQTLLTEKVCMTIYNGKGKKIGLTLNNLQPLNDRFSWAKNLAKAISDAGSAWGITAGELGADNTATPIASQYRNGLWVKVGSEVQFDYQPGKCE